MHYNMVDIENKKWKHVVEKLELTTEFPWWLTVAWPKPAGLQAERIDGAEFVNKLPPKPVNGVLNRFDPELGVVNWNPVADWPKGDGVCPMDEVDWKNPDDWAFPKERPEPNAGLDPAPEEPKIKDEELKAGAEDPPKSGDELEPKAEPLEATNNEVVEGVETKGLDEEALRDELKIEDDKDPKPACPKVAFLGPNGLEDVDEEKGFPVGWLNMPGEPNGLGCVAEGKLVPPAGCPAGFGPPET